MAFVICSYDYKSKNTNVLEYLPFSEVMPYIESFLFDYLSFLQGIPQNFQDMFYSYDSQPHISDLVNGRLFYIKKGNPNNNFQKFTVMEKRIDHGYLYNSIGLVKHLCITFYKDRKFVKFIDYNDGPDSDLEFDNGSAFDKLMKELLEFFDKKFCPNLI